MASTVLGVRVHFRAAVSLLDHRMRRRASTTSSATMGFIMSTQVIVIFWSLLLPKILEMRVILANSAANENVKPSE
jgi:hypothetical protein